MEMGSNQLDQDCNSTEESSFMQLVAPNSPEISGVCGNPTKDPRVGYEYQAEVPPMVSEAEHLLLMNPVEGIVEDSHSFFMGLSIPIMWVGDDNVSKEDDEVCESPELATNVSGTNCTMKKEGSKLNFELLDVILDRGKESELGEGEGEANLNQLCTRNRNRVKGKPSFQPKAAEEANLNQLCKSKNYYAVPGLVHCPWSDADIDGFILGLYIFGKNFVQIKRFLDCKEMGEILSFYYGRFYRSDAYRRWSGSRKTKRKKCISGHRIFSGWRQQELLSRLDAHVPENFRNTLLEVSMEFAKGRISLEDYIFTLKATIGVKALVEAIGIGKGKDDLTGLALEPVKGNLLFPDGPLGKACSSLTTSDIIKLLTGGCRLSKARCNDIFWEAVWPRLLARGWHSEQPKNQGYITNQYLVFLVPGIKKFSRRKLVKGNHYFDSISDVLSKVASEPKLMELEAEEAGGSSCNEEDGWDPGLPSDLDDLSRCQSHQYLKPQVSTCNLNRVKFNVVDSSFGDGEKLSRVREMRYSPDDLKFTSLFTTLESRTPRIFLERSLYEDDLDDFVMPLDGKRNMKIADCNKGDTFGDCGSNCRKFTVVDTSSVHVGQSGRARELRCLPVEHDGTSEMTTSAENEMDSSEDSAYMMQQSSSGQKAITTNHQDKRNKLNEHQSSKIIKHQFSRRNKFDSSVPLVKRRKLTACSDAEIPRVCCALKAPSAGGNDFKIRGYKRKSSSTRSSAEGKPQESSGGILKANCSVMEEHHTANVEHQTSLSIDLNLPQDALDTDNGEAVLVEVENTQNTCLPSKSDYSDPETLGASVDAGPAAEQPNVNHRRQSTRSRPMTIKALTALEYGFLEVKKRPKKSHF